MNQLVSYIRSIHFLRGWFFYVFLHIPRPMRKTWIPLKQLFHHAEKITFLSISDFIRAWILCILTSPGAQHSDSMGKSEQYWAGLYDSARRSRGKICFQGINRIHQVHFVSSHSPNSRRVVPHRAPVEVGSLCLQPTDGTTPWRRCTAWVFHTGMKWCTPTRRWCARATLHAFLVRSVWYLFITCYCFLVDFKQQASEKNPPDLHSTNKYCKRKYSETWSFGFIWAVSELPTDRQAQLAWSAHVPHAPKH